jgi:hypothetical protein
VRGASPQRVVQQGDPALLQPFIDAGMAWSAAGLPPSPPAAASWCASRPRCRRRLPVPVWTSGLLALPVLRRAGVITVDADALGAAHLQAAGADPKTPIEGLARGCSLQRTLLQDLPTLDTARPRPTSWPLRCAWCSENPRSRTWCSNAPTCRPTPPPCSAPPAAPSTT